MKNKEAARRRRKAKEVAKVAYKTRQQLLKAGVAFEDNTLEYIKEKMKEEE